MDFFEIYYSYLEGCSNYNQHQSPEPGWEWHHTLPRCLFGDIRIGLWLTKEQHARASVLQTLAFNKCCITRFHRKHLPEGWWDLAKEQYGALNAGKPQKMLEALKKSGRLENPTAAQLKARRDTAERNRRTLDWKSIQKKAGSSTSSQKWQCLVTGKVLPPGPLSLWQRHRNIDPRMRKKVQ
jgi:hypothetical protein